MGFILYYCLRHAAVVYITTRCEGGDREGGGGVGAVAGAFFGGIGVGALLLTLGLLIIW